MSIYISGVDLPKDGEITLYIDASGRVSYFEPKAVHCVTQAVPVPPHGGLISLDMALDECEKPTIYDLTDVPDFLRELPVIIPAEREAQHEHI